MLARRTRRVGVGVAARLCRAVHRHPATTARWAGAAAAAASPKLRGLHTDRPLSTAAAAAAATTKGPAISVLPKRLHIAIAGCGVAGLSTALLLHRDGHRVTLFERFETARPVGSGLLMQPTGMSVMRRLGLEERVLRHGARIDRLHGELVCGRVVLDVGYDALNGWIKTHGAHVMHGTGIHRAALFTILHDAVRAEGIEVVTGRVISGADADAGTLRFEGGSTAGPFDMVVDALGSRSALVPSAVGCEQLKYGALWTALDWPEHDSRFVWNRLQQRYRAASNMCGVMPCGTVPAPRGSSGAPANATEELKRQVCLFWSLRADKYDAWARDGLDKWKEEVLALWPQTAPLVAQITDASQLTFARYAHRTLQNPRTGARLIHVGDAWHSTSPQLGQGANHALLDAWSVAKAVRDTKSDLNAALDKAVAQRNFHVRLYQAMSFAFTPVYQSDSRVLPWVRDGLVGPLSHIWPLTTIQAGMVSGLVGWPLRPLGLA